MDQASAKHVIATLEGLCVEALGKDAAAWNQAVMDLGASRCRPRSPRCEGCPVSSWCTGPDTYRPPRRQPRFDGSLRQARGAVMRHVIRGPATLLVIAESTGIDTTRVRSAVEALVDEGMVRHTPSGEIAVAD